MLLKGWQWNSLIGFTRREGLDIYYVAYVDGSKGRRPVGCSGGNGGCHMEIQMIHIAEKMMWGKMALVIMHLLDK